MVDTCGQKGVILPLKSLLSPGSAVRPDYLGNGLVNLVASVMQACGAAPRPAPLEALGTARLAAARNIVLLIIDGLGDGYLRRKGAGGELARRRLGAITSVFPSTTASAITTSYTGCTPLEHGLTGWHTYFGAAGCVAAPLPFRSRGDELPLGARGVHAGDLFCAAPLFDALAVRPIVVTDRAIIDSPYNLHHCGRAERRAYADLQGFIGETEAAVKSGAGRKLVYAYWPQYDALSHRFGSESAEAFAQFSRLDEAFGSLLRRLAGTDSIVLATADHGFIDVPPEEALELPAALAALLRFPLCGERRIAFCHVRCRHEFIARARDWLGERAEVRPSRDLVEEGWFGPGTPHPRFSERIGDVAIRMRGRAAVKDWVFGEPRHLHIGNHGGAAESEMMIPLILEET
jgi:hypothetical protein